MGHNDGSHILELFSGDGLGEQLSEYPPELLGPAGVEHAGHGGWSVGAQALGVTAYGEEQQGEKEDEAFIGEHSGASKGGMVYADVSLQLIFYSARQGKSRHLVSAAKQITVDYGSRSRGNFAAPFPPLRAQEREKSRRHRIKKGRAKLMALP